MSERNQGDTRILPRRMNLQPFPRVMAIPVSVAILAEHPALPRLYLPTEPPEQALQLCTKGFLSPVCIVLQELHRIPKPFRQVALQGAVEYIMTLSVLRHDAVRTQNPRSLRHAQVRHAEKPLQRGHVQLAVSEIFGDSNPIRVSQNTSTVASSRVARDRTGKGAFDYSHFSESGWR
jgi:hypothetical protein